jgi:ribosomal protein S12 methylthiotransferase accessory factor
MSRASQGHAFGFLDDNGTVEFEALLARQPRVDVSGVPSRLNWMIDRLTALGMDAYVVNLTADELTDVGLRCCRVIVPQLMPMSLITRGRFLATPRLHQVNRSECLNRTLPDDINPLPQPFA